MPAEPAGPGGPTPAPPPTTSPDTPPSLSTTEERAATPQSHHPEQHPVGRRLAVLALTALGVVYGDIGTSPLYAIKEAFHPSHGVQSSAENVYGVLSLILWSLTLIVSVKYIMFVLRADNRGEGGTLALLALIQQRLHRGVDARRNAILVALALFGTSLLFGEGIITPAISVLSAVEGLEVAAPALQDFVVPIAVAILFVVFMVQRHGTANVGRIFGPIMLLWFVSIAAVGTLEIAREPQILLAVNPWYAVQFFAHNGVPGFFILGAVVLVITGAEALYADIGHFGPRPIRTAWFAVALPALLLNYFGQGALLLRDATAAQNPFYLLVPGALRVPMLFLATAAAVIASQALISGAFSLSQQAMQLGYSPRVTISHTSAHRAGQVYVREINTLLMLGCITLVLAFGSASGLAAAYGVAVTGTMIITTVLFTVVARQRFNWSGAKAAAFVITFLAIDLSFFVANVAKLRSGGWVPLAIGLAMYTLMTTWKRGREALYEILQQGAMPLDLFLADVERRKPQRVSGTAVFMTSSPAGAPVVLLHHLKHNKVLHDQVLLLSIAGADVPYVPPTTRSVIEPLGQGFYRVQARYGFMETPNVPEIMRACESAGIRARALETTYYLGRERVITSGKSRLARWRKKLFAFMSRNARSATEFFGIPPNRVVELGAQIEF
ncbi:MAG TPA: potassium transporter Kup [Gemmatimonadaceae bacterium]|nr:potassium transporter Kup [Gemmatimonadaceae bacterium]